MKAPQFRNFSSKDFGSRIESSLKHLQKEKFFCDVTITCEGQKIDAHKVVLARGSRLFDNIFKVDPQPQPLIFISDVKFSYLLNILDFMYQGEVSIDKADRNNFLAVAHDLEVNDVTEEAFKDSKQSMEDKSKKRRLGNSPKHQVNIDYKIKTDSKLDDSHIVVNDFKTIDKLEGFEQFADEDFEDFKDSKQSIEDIEDKNKKQRLASSPNQQFKLDFKIKTDDILDDFDTVVNDLKIDELEDFKQFGDEDFVDFDDESLGITMKKNLMDSSPTPAVNVEYKIKIEMENKISEISTQDTVKGLSNGRVQRLQIRDIAKLSGNENEDQSISFDCNASKTRFECEQCNKTYMSKFKLKTHILSVHEGVQYPCSDCDYKADTASHLKVHILSIHEGMRYPCSQCDYKATTTSNLKAHVLSIHERMQYPCSQCDYKATTKGDVKKHVLSIHEGMRYPCPHCDFKATTKGDVKKHVLSIHEGMRYPCPHCDFKAATTSHLKRHVSSIHEGMQYPCSYCDKTFTRKMNLKTHINKYHKLVKE